MDPQRPGVSGKILESVHGRHNAGRTGHTGDGLEFLQQVGFKTFSLSQYQRRAAMDNEITKASAQFLGACFNLRQRLFVCIFLPASHHACHRDEPDSFGNDTVKIIGVELDHRWRDVVYSRLITEHNVFLSLCRRLFKTNHLASSVREKSKIWFAEGKFFTRMISFAVSRTSDLAALSKPPFSVRVCASSSYNNRARRASFMANFFCTYGIMIFGLSL